MLDACLENIELVNALNLAAKLRFCGNMPIEQQIVHSVGFAAVSPIINPGNVVDLGSGGGLPGLVLAHVWKESNIVLLDSSVKRSSFLMETVSRLNLSSKVSVLNNNAELAARSLMLRSRFDVVTSRSFGKPATTVECGLPFLKPGGVLIVSEQPYADNPDDSKNGKPLTRWPANSLSELGAKFISIERYMNSFNYAVIKCCKICPDKYPRRVGLPRKYPLF